MKLINILTIFYFFLINAKTNADTKYKFCRDCKYFLNPGPFRDLRFAKCSFFEKENIYESSLEKIKNRESLLDFLVTHENEAKINQIKEKEYHYCSTARYIDSMCGTEAKNFVSKEQDIISNISLISLLLLNKMNNINKI